MIFRLVQGRYFLHVLCVCIMCIHYFPSAGTTIPTILKFLQHLKYPSGRVLTSSELWECVHCKLDILSMLSAHSYSFTCAGSTITVIAEIILALKSGGRQLSNKLRIMGICPLQAKYSLHALCTLTHHFTCAGSTIKIIAEIIPAL